MFALTDSSILVTLGETIDLETNRRVHALAARLAQNPLEGVMETVPGYASLTVHYDPLTRTHAEVTEWLAAHLNVEGQASPHPPRRVEVPVIYDGPDLPFVAQHCRLSVDEVIRLHSENEYLVFMMGFMPGFPYLGRLPEALHVPRLETPRTHVPAGSVAIAGGQTGIYPQDSPGGWRLIGRTDLKLYDPNREQPFLFAPGDIVRFVAG
jgi:KipI family sensor histidine kinase inhibitor